MKRTRRLAALLVLLLLCLGTLPQRSRAERPDEYAECMWNAEGSYYTCLNMCDMTGKGPVCYYSCRSAYQTDTENCDRFYPDTP